MDLLFVIDSRHHGKGSIIFAWHPFGLCVASTGVSRVVQIADPRGILIDQIVPPSPSTCTSLEWDKDGDTLAIIQTASSIIVLWDTKTKRIRHFDTGIKDLTYIKWSKTSYKLAIGNNKGIMMIYDKEHHEKMTITTRLKKKIVTGDWSSDDTLAFASEDRQIIVCTSAGEILDQVKLKRNPISLSFGGKQQEKDGIVSVNMDGQTILLYSLNGHENALELAFQSRYGNIISYRWFGDGYLIAGFSTGHIVIISTHAKEIGQEQYCEKYHNSLQDISYNASNGLIATCDEFCFKVITMMDWKEIICETLDRDAGALDHIAWTSNGNILTISSRNGCLYNFSIPLSNTRLGEVSESDTCRTLFITPISPFSLIATCIIILLSIGVVVTVATDLYVTDLVRSILGISEAI